MLTNDFLPDIDAEKLVALRKEQQLCRLSDEVHFHYFFFHNFQLLWVKSLSLSCHQIVPWYSIIFLLIKGNFHWSLLRTCLEITQGNWLRKIFQRQIEYLNLAPKQCKIHGFSKYSFLRDQVIAVNYWTKDGSILNFEFWACFSCYLFH